MPEPRQDAELRQDEIAVLFATWEASHGSLNAHVPEHAMRNKIVRSHRRLFKEALKSILRRPEAYIIRHPTGGEMTYQITRNGRDKLFELGLISYS